MVTYSKIISTVGKVIFPSLLWNFDIKEKIIYLTFDDGPIPEITPWVLKKLRDYNAKATFFCIGDNVVKNPEIFKMILQEGHAIGNHTYNHLNGWETDRKTYTENILKAETVIQKFINIYNKTALSHLPGNKLFRPPFGRIAVSQIKDLGKFDYKIVMWDVISGDYDQNKGYETCLRNVIKHTRPGSILVFHDSTKAFNNLQRILPEVLSIYSKSGFEFRSL